MADEENVMGNGVGNQQGTVKHTGSPNNGMASRSTASIIDVHYVPRDLIRGDIWPFSLV